MFNRLRQAAAEQSGYVLMEVMLVTSIIGATVVAAAPSFDGVLQHAKEVACWANLHMMDTVITVRSFETGEQPNSIQVLVDEGYLRKMPREPFGGSYSIEGGYAACSEGHEY